MLPSNIFSIALLLIVSTINFTSAYTITFVNKCSYTVWPAIGAAPNGQPNNSIKFGARLNPGQSVSHGIDDHAIGVRGWGRTGCDGSGANCKTGACSGGLVCNDAGITSHAILSEYGYGANNREYWNLSFVGGTVNIPAQLHNSDGQTVTCKDNNCPRDQSFHDPNDFQAVRSSPVGVQALPTSKISHEIMPRSFPLSQQPWWYTIIEKRDDTSGSGESDAACYGSCPGRGQKYQGRSCLKANQCENIVDGKSKTT